LEIRVDGVILLQKRTVARRAVVRDDVKRLERT
jgi:hypothetical protein